MIIRSTCAHCRRDFTWNDITPRVCNRCFIAGVDPVPAVVRDEARMALKALMAAVKPGLHVKINDVKKWKPLARELKRSGLVLDQVAEDGWMVFVPTSSTKKPSRGRCYVCSPAKCRHAHPLHSGCSSMSRSISDAEARKVILPAYIITKPGSDSFLSDADKTLQHPLTSYSEAMGGCEPCREGKWCDAHPGAVTGRNDKTGEWFSRQQESAA